MTPFYIALACNTIYVVVDLLVKADVIKDLGIPALQHTTSRSYNCILYILSRLCYLGVKLI